MHPLWPIGVLCALLVIVGIASTTAEFFGDSLLRGLAFISSLPFLFIAIFCVAEKSAVLGFIALAPALWFTIVFALVPDDQCGHTAYMIRYCAAWLMFLVGWGAIVLLAARSWKVGKQK